MKRGSLHCLKFHPVRVGNPLGRVQDLEGDAFPVLVEIEDDAGRGSSLSATGVPTLRMTLRVSVRRS
jgi:hypothetical protein